MLIIFDIIGTRNKTIRLLSNFKNFFKEILSIFKKIHYKNRLSFNTFLSVAH